ncbi:hypothetical protein UNDYM_5914 (plasmid) [Undibacterium sp. YM2]|uniref:tyrosine-type recombinase/integrase n=1 Tax=Undibacterium sp. YM2 TaxID=2058625 RepID=UPI001331DA85|nr:site-specific integrase [Undibacterium sp. YM2]BBB70167.1 hypothetical protein UNDYM_5914 [Undibacterium sp. YM2]
MTEPMPEIDETAAPAPFFALSKLDNTPASSLDGTSGINRATLTPWITASNDSEAIKAWLRNFDAESHTYRAYEKESLRLLLWAVLEQKKPLSSLVTDDFEDYFKFLANPPTHWISTARVERESPEWAPLRAPLKPSSIKQAKVILNAMMIWLVNARYLAGNPLAIVRQKRSSQIKRPSRYLPMTTWEFFWDWLETWPEITDRQQRDKLRIQMLFSLLYVTAARLSDVAQATMGDLRQDDDGYWWWHVVGKGDKEGEIPITPELLGWIKRYRVLNGLTRLPSPGEKIALFFRSNGPSEDRLSDSVIYRTVTKTMRKAAAEADLREQFDISARLRDASTHWMRHTALTHQAQAGMNIVTIKANARHNSIATTSKYLHDEEKLRHKENRDQVHIRRSQGN